MKYITLLFSLYLITNAFSQTSSQKVIKTVEIAEIKAEIKKHDFIILDVRTPEEFAAGHLKNAININYYDKDFVERVSSLDKRKKVVVYCAVGGRSGQALTKMDALGFQYVLNMKGGYNAWKTQQ
jgi:rhodanese-related sulfurtransferase